MVCASVGLKLGRDLNLYCSQAKAQGEKNPGLASTQVTEARPASLAFWPRVDSMLLKNLNERPSFSHSHINQNLIM